MTARDDAIEAGAQALHGDECPDDEHDLCDVGAWDRAAAAVVDAVEPIFEAEADRRVDRMILWNTNHLASLRAQVEALPVVLVDLDPDPHGRPIVRQAVLLSEVLALLGGESDGAALTLPTLRAKVKGLESPLHWNDGEDALIYRSQVLALLGGESDDDPMCVNRLPGWCYCDLIARVRADERERIADLVQMKFSMTSARTHDDTCVCILCAINSTVDAAVDYIRGGESDG